MAQAANRGRALDLSNASPLQMASAAVGALFLLVGILGFIPGITTDFGDMKFAGEDSRAELFGIFQVSVLHNLVHLAFGVLGLAAARTLAASRLYLLLGGAIYLLLTLYGALVDRESDANFIPLNTADDWLHLVLGLGMLALGLALGSQALKGRGAARTRGASSRHRTA